MKFLITRYDNRESLLNLERLEFAVRENTIITYHFTCGRSIDTFATEEEAKERFKEVAFKMFE